MKKIGMIRSMLELMGVVFLRFRPVPRLWSVWLVGVNGAGLLFYQHLEAQVALAVVAVAVIAQALIYQRQRFTRILGIAHVMWVPMFAWMATRLPEIAATPGLANWLVLLAATNGICMVIDTIDAVRYVKGERAPHYQMWPA